MSGAISRPATIGVIGSINIDLVVRTDCFARPGETRMAREWRPTPGGKGANQAVAAARLGGVVQFCGRVGADEYGELLRQRLLDERIDVGSLQIDQDVSSGAAVILVNDEGQNAIYVVGGANQRWTHDSLDALRPSLRKWDCLLLQLEVPINVTLRAIAMARSKGVTVCLDPAPAPVGSVPPELLQVDLLTPNEAETQALTGLPLGDLQEAKAAAQDLQRRGARQVVLKLGQRGALALAENGVAAHIEPAQVNVVDTTAAGDAFSAALGVAIARGEDLISATRFACSAGAAAVTRSGAQEAMPTFTEVQTLLKSQEFRVSIL